MECNNLITKRASDLKEGDSIYFHGNNRNESGDIDLVLDVSHTARCYQTMLISGAMRGSDSSIHENVGGMTRLSFRCEQVLEVIKK